MHFMRQSRLLKEGACYHVTAQINKKELLLDSPAAKRLFIDVLMRARKKYSFRVENFSIMGNHYHLMIEPRNGNSLSDIMRWIMSVFAMAYNRHNNSCGHVWNGRFFSRIIHSIGQFIKIFAYIDENPVVAQLISNKFDWEFGGLWHHRRGLNSIIDAPHDFILAGFPEHAQISFNCLQVR